MNMAILLCGKSKCAICGLIIEEDDPVFMFSAFFINEHPELELFNDGAFHYDCVLKHPLGAEAISKLHPDSTQK